MQIWDPAGISKSPAIFDPLKLRAINAEYIRRLTPEEFRQKADPWLDEAIHCPVDRDLLCANLQPRCELLSDIPQQVDFFDRLPDYDLSLYTNKKQKTTPASALEALQALELLLSDEGTDYADRDGLFDACKALAERMEHKKRLAAVPAGHRPVGQAAHPRRRGGSGLHDGP